MLAPIRKVTTFRIDDELLPRMEALKERDGIHFSEQIRRALRMFLDVKGIPTPETERKRAATRKRS